MPKIVLRPYQEQAVDAVYEHLRNRDDNPCIVLPTASGKSIVLAKIATDAVKQWGGRVLLLAHVKELLEQNAEKIRLLAPDLHVGVYSAGLNSRDTEQDVIVAGIQSVYNRACELGRFDLIIVDEAHLIAPDGDGMYQTFLKDMKVINPHVRLIGLTATPFRMRGGMICKPENLLNHVCYDAGIKEMISQGYLSPLISKAGRVEAQLDNLHIRAGEFISSEMEEAMDKDEITISACREIIEKTKDRKAVLIFTTSIKHCNHVKEKIEEFTGGECAMVTGDTPANERAEILARIKGEVVQNGFWENKPPLKFLANVNVLTTGFDAPNIDCIVLLRPTASPGLLVQAVGRGFRLSPETGKKDCLVLDYGGNILRHGPIDCIKVKDKSSGKGGGEAPAKKCPECSALIHAAYAICPECGFEFPPPSRSNLSEHASREGILSGQVEFIEHEVQAIFYNVHEKRGAEVGTPKTMRVDYKIGFETYKSEWCCPEHKGYARNKFMKWWDERAALGCPMPTTAQEAVNLAQDGFLSEVESITVKTVSGERFDTITGYKLKERPVYREPGDDEMEIPIGFSANDVEYDDIPF